MDKDVEEALSRLDSTTVATLQASILRCAVEALIATHPNQAALRDEFARLLAEFQTTASMMGTSADTRLVARAFADSLLPRNP